MSNDPFNKSRTWNMGAFSVGGHRPPPLTSCSAQGFVMIYHQSAGQCDLGEIVLIKLLGTSSFAEESRDMRE